MVETEMLARIGKNLVRERLRQSSKETGVVSDVVGREVVAKVFTELLFDIEGVRLPPTGFNIYNVFFSLPIM